jgi:cell fate regulator YaaT (PSP1 superfamily)
MATDAVQNKFLVRYGSMRILGEFESETSDPVIRGSRVIVRSDRGTEVGDTLCVSTPELIAQVVEPTFGQILRIMTEDDLAREKMLNQRRNSDYDKAVELIQKHQLAMQMVDVEALFGGERTIFYFLAEKRVDFRELVKSMAREFQTRIELRQIGVRDEAKLLADYGDCGKVVCCNSHMTVMPPVTMRMAKIQKSTLDPTKISGRCGRLKCCLRFENDVYEEFLKELPAIGSRILTRKGQGRVLAQEILARKVLVEFEDGRRIPVTADEVLSTLGK